MERIAQEPYEIARDIEEEVKVRLEEIFAEAEIPEEVLREAWQAVEEAVVLVVEKVARAKAAGRLGDAARMAQELSLVDAVKDYARRHLRDGEFLGRDDIRRLAKIWVGTLPSVEGERRIYEAAVEAGIPVNPAFAMMFRSRRAQELSLTDVVEDWAKHRIGPGEMFDPDDVNSLGELWFRRAPTADEKRQIVDAAMQIGILIHPLLTMMNHAAQLAKRAQVEDLIGEMEDEFANWSSGMVRDFLTFLDEFGFREKAIICEWLGRIKSVADLTNVLDHFEVEEVVREGTGRYVRKAQAEELIDRIEQTIALFPSGFKRSIIEIISLTVYAPALIGPFIETLRQVSQLSEDDAGEVWRHFNR